MQSKKLPVTVLSGFLGAGKTSVLNYVLNNKMGLKVAVIVNDMSEINFDANLIDNQNILSRTDEKLVEMSNGCICCTLREDLMIEVKRLAEENRFDYLLIESTGISEPVPVAQTFSFVDENNNLDLSKISYIDTLVTVVDVFNFYKDFGSAETLQDRKLTDMEDDYRTIVNLLTDQIEFANVILLNKIDLVSQKELKTLKATIKKLNPKARIIETSFGHVNPYEIINTKLFNLEEAENESAWIEEMQKDFHKPETEEYGISSFIYRSRKPFDPEKFWNYLQNNFHGSVIRSKGVFWLASRPDQALIWNQAGGSLRAESAGVWWSSMPFHKRIEYASFIENQLKIEKDWHKLFGDRKNEITFIGQNMNREKIIEDLDNCLLSDEESITNKWKVGYRDNWPVQRAYAIE